MIIAQDYKVWISVEQRLDGLTSRYGPDPYITVTLHPGKDEKNIVFNVDLAMAKVLAKGLTKAAKRAADA